MGRDLGDPWNQGGRSRNRIAGEVGDVTTCTTAAEGEEEDSQVWRHSEMVVASRRRRWQSGHVRQRASRSRLTMTEPLPAAGAGAAAGDAEAEAAPRRARLRRRVPLLGSSCASSPSS